MRLIIIITTTTTTLLHSVQKKGETLRQKKGETLSLHSCRTILICMHSASMTYRIAYRTLCCGTYAIGRGAAFADGVHVLPRAISPNALNANELHAEGGGEMIRGEDTNQVSECGQILLNT